MTTFHSDTPDMRTGTPRISEGNPKVVVGPTGTKNVAMCLSSYAEQDAWPHFTVDVDSKTAIQHISLTDASTMYLVSDTMAPHRKSESYWIMVNRNSGDTLTSDEEDYLYTFLIDLATEVGADPVVMQFPRSQREAIDNELTLDLWSTFSGIMPASLAPQSKWHSSFQLNVDDIMVRWLLSDVTVADEIPVDVNSDVPVLGAFKGRPVMPGSGGKRVLALREAYGLEVGTYDEVLEAIVKNVQEKAGIDPDAKIDAATWLALQGDLEV